MDCSTFSNRTSVDDTTTADEESAGALRKQLEAALRGCEATQQDLHEARRNYQTALDVQHHLTAELDAQRTGEERRAAELRAKIITLQEEVQHLREERATTADSHSQQVEVFQSKLRNLEKQLSLKMVEETVAERSNGTDDELITLRNDNNTLRSRVLEQKNTLEEKESAVTKLQNEIEELSADHTWAIEAVKKNKEELESLSEALHLTQGELFLAKAQLQSATNESNSHAEKGNSLFAEVEDKRQEMAKTLIQMKQQNVQLKRELVNKQVEIDSLLCEKRTLWEEVAGLSGVLDAEMIKSYEKRITELSSTVEHQRREQARFFCRYYEAGGSQAAEWVSGVLAHLRNRCNQLTDTMLEISVDNLSQASQIRELHKKMAYLRLKAFKAGAGTHKPHSDTQHKKELIEVEVPPCEVKQEIKMEALVALPEDINGAGKIKGIVPKKETNLNDIEVNNVKKKKVTF